MLSHTWFGKPNQQWKKKNEDYFCHLFLKALGYFLLPSSFFPDQEFSTPHGFLIGEEGESPRTLQPCCLPTSTLKLRGQGVGVSCALPAHFKWQYTHVSWKHFLKRCGGEPNVHVSPSPQGEKKRECMHERVCVCVCMCLCMCVCARARLCVSTYVYTHMCTHTHTLSLSSEGEGERGE